MTPTPLDPFEAVRRAIPRRDWALCAAEMFIWTTGKPLALGVCLAGERDWVRLVKRTGAYQSFQFLDDDLRAIFRMICDHYREDLIALDANGPVHV